MSLAAFANTNSRTSFDTPHDVVHWGRPFSGFVNRGSKRKHNVKYTLAVYEKSLRRLFDSQLSGWLEDTQWKSSSRAITSHPNYKRLVQMGSPVIPLVLQKMIAGDVK